MGVFSDLLEQLDRDVATVHGRPLPLRWRRDPAAPPEARWYAFLEGGLEPMASAFGASGEDPLRRLVERYAELAKLKRESRTYNP